MGKKRLYLLLNETTIEAVKQYAQKNNLVLSEIFEDYIEFLINKQKQNDQKLKALKKIKGSGGSVPSNFDYKEAITDYLMEKYK